MISDRGSCFTSEEFASFCETHCVQHIKIATSSPQSNKQVERFNRCLTPMLSKECEVEPSDWTKHLQKVEFALNNTVNKSTGFCPSVLLFGVQQKGIFNDIIKENLEKNIISEETRDLESIRKEANKKTVQNQEKQKQYYDENHKKPHVYNVGDFAVVKKIVNTPGTNEKLLPKFKGPFEVVKKLQNDRYLIKDLENLQVSRIPYEGVACPQNMKPYV